MFCYNLIKFLIPIIYLLHLFRMDNMDEFVVDADNDSLESATPVAHVIGVLVPSLFVSICILALLLMYLIKHHNLRGVIITAKARLVSRLMRQT